MSFRDRLTHTLLVAHPDPTVSPDSTGQLFTDATGQPVGDSTGDPTIIGVPWQDATEVIGLVQEMTSKWPEGPGAGPQLVDTRIYMPFGTQIGELDKVQRVDIVPPEVYQVVFKKDAGGRGHHIEVQARRIPL